MLKHKRALQDQRRSVNLTCGLCWRVMALISNSWKRKLTAYRTDTWPFNLAAAL